MLQKYVFLDKENVNVLQKEVITFIKKIKDIGPADDFDPDLYFPEDLAEKVKKKRKGKWGLFYVKAKAFFDKYKVLGAQRKLVLNAFLEMNKINALFEKSSKRITIDDLPASIRDETRSLFVFLYENTLTSYGVARHYKAFTDAQKNNWCPFCGMEKLVHYTHQKEDYDHLLAKSVYPFASVNMRNLAPMGKNCNRIHKKAKDLIWNSVKQVKAINPYVSKLDIEIGFDGTILPTRGKKNGNWKLKMKPDREEVSRWDSVFNISDRIVKDCLENGVESDYDLWLTEYLNNNDNKIELNTIAKVRASLKHYGAQFDHQSYREGRYVKSSLFKWIGLNAPDDFIESLMNVINKKKLAA